MTKRKTILIQKEPSKGTAPNNYRPITLLPMMWKILTAQIRETIYIDKHERRLSITTRNNMDNTIDERMTTTRKQKWEGNNKRLINNISHQKTWTWQRKGNLKRET